MRRLGECRTIKADLDLFHVRSWIFKGRGQDGVRKKARRCQMNLDRFSEEDREEQRNRKSVGGRIEGIARL